jgi:hypothetical protein
MRNIYQIILPDSPLDGQRATLVRKHPKGGRTVKLLQGAGAYKAGDKLLLGPQEWRIVL